MQLGFRYILHDVAIIKAITGEEIFKRNRSSRGPVLY